MARALIGPTGYGTFGIVWRDFPALEARGGYSGPYDDKEQAEQGARDWCAGYDEPLEIIEVADVNDPDGTARLCAVDDCPERGRPQVCIYDDKYHHHGMIHYDRTIPSALTFRDGPWRGLCNDHYAILQRELEQHRADRVRSQLGKALLG